MPLVISIKRETHQLMYSLKQNIIFKQMLVHCHREKALCEADEAKA